MYMDRRGTEEGKCDFHVCFTEDLRDDEETCLALGPVCSGTYFSCVSQTSELGLRSVYFSLVHALDCSYRPAVAREGPYLE